MTTPPKTSLPKLEELLTKTSAPKPEPEALFVPDVVGHYMLVALPAKVEKTAGGIYVPDDVAEAERAATVVGHVLKVGPDCYVGNFPNGLPRFPGGAWCKEGDYVIFGRYTGHRIRISGVEFRILADDQILATIDSDALKEISGL